MYALMLSLFATLSKSKILNLKFSLLVHVMKAMQIIFILLTYCSVINKLRLLMTSITYIIHSMY